MIFESKEQELMFMNVFCFGERGAEYPPEN